MELIAFICISAVCFISSVLYAIFENKKEGSAFVKAFTYFSIIALSLVSTYFSGVMNVLGLFISLSCVAMMLGEMMDVADKKWGTQIGYVLSSGLLLTAFVSLNQFSLLPLFGGVLCGLGLGFVSWAFNGEKNAINITLDIFKFVFLGGAVSLGIINLFNSYNFVMSVILLSGSIFVLIGAFINSLNLKSKVANSISKWLVAFGFVLIASSTYF